jgi:lipopolysaccharide cholinephosphotransferase
MECEMIKQTAAGVFSALVPDIITLEVRMVNLRIDLPEGFLDEEVRNGYTVTSKAKRAWAVQIDLLIKLDEVCKKYGLRYFADSGTLLGAARDHGFIP